MTTTGTDTLSWETGQELDSLTLPAVDRLTLIKYAGASGDYNPIHTVDQMAIDLGLPGLIQHGMLTMAEVGRLFSPYLDHGFLSEFQARFKGMVFLGDVLTVGGKVTGVAETQNGKAYKFDIYSRNQKGEDVATGKATFVVS